MPQKADGVQQFEDVTTQTNIATLLALHNVPSQNNTTNVRIRDVIGNKTDIANETVDVASLVGLLRAVLADTTGLNGAAMRGTDNAALASVATETRLAELDAANIPADLIRVQSSRDFWAANQPTITITGASTTVTPTNTVVVPAGVHGLPVGATIDCVHLLVKWRQTEDTSAVDNAINNVATAIQIDDSVNTGWLTALAIPDNSYMVDVSVSTITSGDMQESITDIKSRVDAADTYDIQIINAQADGNNLILRDFQWGVRIFWH